MNKITYEKEVRRAILHFMSVMDGVKIKRYDVNGVEYDTIKVGIGFHPKSATFKDLTNDSGHITLPFISVNLSNISYDAERAWNKTHENDTHRRIPENNKVYNYTSPIPINLEFDLEITTVYYEDLLQIINNFLPYTNPYLVVSMKEPFTGSEQRCQINWSGAIPINVPEKWGPDEMVRYSASTSFTFETYIFKAKTAAVDRICCIDWSVSTENNWNQYTLNKDRYEEKYHFNGIPIIKQASPHTIPLGQDTKIKIYGEQLGQVHGVVLSGNSTIFGPLSNFNYFPASENFKEFKGVALTDFTTSENHLSFHVNPKNEGFFDIILINDCGYLKLTEPADKTQYTLSSNCFDQTIKIPVESTNMFDSNIPSCSSCYWPHHIVFEHGIEVNSKWNSACINTSPCFSALSGFPVICDQL